MLECSDCVVISQEDQWLIPSGQRLIRVLNSRLATTPIPLDQGKQVPADFEQRIRNLLTTARLIDQRITELLPRLEEQFLFHNTPIPPAPEKPTS